MPRTSCTRRVNHSLGISVMPLSGDRVLLKQRREPLLAFGFPLPGRLPLGLLQDELLIGRLRLVLVVDGPGHVLPQSDGDQKANVERVINARRGFVII